MSAPTCPALAFAGSVTTLAALTLTLTLDAIYTSLTATVNGLGVTIPVASRPQVTKAGAPTEYVILEPATTSAVAGKWVIIIAGGAALQPGGGAGNASCLSPDTSAVAQLYIGIWMANSGATVSRADLTAVWTTNAANGGFTGNGTFSGFIKFYGALTTVASVTAYVSQEHVVFEVETTTGTRYCADAGFGVRGVSTDALDSESGMLGRVFTIGTSGSGGPLVVNWQTLNIDSTTKNTPLTYYGVNAASHHYYRIPGATTGSALNTTMRPCSWCGQPSVTAGNGLGASDAAQYVAASGTIEPDSVSMRDCGSATARLGIKVGRHRAMFFGPRKRSRYTLSTGGVPKWISACSATSTADTNDCVLLPM